MISEHEAFQRLTDALDRAAASATDVGFWRPDQQRGWNKIAETLRVAREACFRLAGEGTTGKHNG